MHGQNHIKRDVECLRTE